MRKRALARAALLAAALLVLPGCFVFDELDAGMEMMEKNSPKKPGEKAGAAAPAEEEAQKPAGESWWSQARSYAPGSADADDSTDADALVRCDLRGSSRFMRRGDCVSQGGRPASG